jgi:hypothetical protein
MNPRDDELCGETDPESRRPESMVVSRWNPWWTAVIASVATAVIALFFLVYVRVARLETRVAWLESASRLPGLPGPLVPVRLVPAGPDTQTMRLELPKEAVSLELVFFLGESASEPALPSPARIALEISILAGDVVVRSAGLGVEIVEGKAAVRTYLPAEALQTGLSELRLEAENALGEPHFLGLYRLEVLRPE